MKKLNKIICSATAAGILLLTTLPLSACAKTSSDDIVLRVSSWEEYIDLGDWDEDERIDIGDGDGIIGYNSMVDDFAEWFNSTHDFKVKVEYSTFGTNEDLYNRLNLGDVYDIVCPSEYLIMQLIREGKADTFTQDFYDTSIEENYYAKYAMPFIRERFANNSVVVDGTGEVLTWEQCAACYMWGTTGIVYNKDDVETEHVSTWNMLKNSEYKARVTVKDNVRDSYFAALGILNSEELNGGNVTPERRSSLFNATDDETISEAEQILKQIKNNVYSFETDSGKADMITGKIAANFQWSGDAVFIMDEVDGDESSDTELWYSVPSEGTDLYLDGWVMLKKGIDGNAKKKIAAQAFINFVSKPENAIRNMNFIGYTSAIGGELAYEYFDWKYGVDFDAASENFDADLNEVFEYDLSYFFGDGYSIYIPASDLDFGERALSRKECLGEEFGNDIEYTVYYGTDDISQGRQAFSQYPTRKVMERTVIMNDFGNRLSAINQMWINVRCLDVKNFNPAVVWSVVGIVLAGAVAITLYKLRYKIFYRTTKREVAQAQKNI